MTDIDRTAAERPTLCPRTGDLCKGFNYCSKVRCYLVDSGADGDQIQKLRTALAEKERELREAQRNGADWRNQRDRLAEECDRFLRNGADYARMVSERDRLLRERDEARAEVERLRAMRPAYKRFIGQVEDAERQRIQKSELYRRGDTILVWVNEGQILFGGDCLDDPRSTPAPSSAPYQKAATQGLLPSGAIACPGAGGEMENTDADLVEKARKIAAECSVCQRVIPFIAAALAAEREDATRRAYERAARVVEEGQESQRSNVPGKPDGPYISPRGRGNLAGLAYAAAIRALPDTTEAKEKQARESPAG